MYKKFAQLGAQAKMKNGKEEVKSHINVTCNK